MCPTWHQLSGVGGATGGIAVGAAIAVATNIVAKSDFISLSQFAKSKNRRFLPKTQPRPITVHFLRNFEGERPYCFLKLRENCDKEEKPVATATSRTPIIE